MKRFKDRDLQIFIGLLLRIGVMVAMFLVVTGLMFFLLQSPGSLAGYRFFDETRLLDFNDFWDKLTRGESTAIMNLGVMALIATPIARVFFTMIGFALEKDRLYTFISFLVLCIIVLSMIYEVGE